MGTYFRVDCDVMVKRLGLSGNDLCVYALIASLSKGERGLVRSYQWIADNTGITRRGVIKVVNRLEKKGLLGVFEGEGMLMEFRCASGEQCSPRTSEQSSPQVVNEIHQESEQSSPQVVNEIHQPHNNEYSNDNSNSISNNGSNAQPQKKNFYGVVLEVWCEHYKNKFGTEYVPNWTNVSTDGHTLEVALEKKMAEYGYSHEDEQQVREFLHDMLEAFYSVADKWQKEHWSLHTVATQFNQLYNAAVNNNGNGNKQTIEGTNISAEYIARQCAILAK